MTIQCSWCRKWLGDKAPFENHKTTHSICKSCAHKIEQKSPTKYAKTSDDILTRGKVNF